MIGSRGFVYSERFNPHGGKNMSCKCEFMPGISGKTHIEGYEPGIVREKWKQILNNLNSTKPKYNVRLEPGYVFSNGGYGNQLAPRDAIIYKTTDGTDFVFPVDMDSALQTMTPQKAIELWFQVPEKIRNKAPKTIQFVDYYNPADSYWKKHYKGFTNSYATGGDVITFYRWVDHDDGYVVRTYCHESGHYIDKQSATTKDRYSSEAEWKKAMFDDTQVSGKPSPTTYGENSPTEDFAESLAEYVKDEISFTAKFPNRALIIARIIFS